MVCSFLLVCLLDHDGTGDQQQYGGKVGKVERKSRKWWKASRKQRFDIKKALCDIKEWPFSSIDITAWLIMSWTKAFFDIIAVEFHTSVMVQLT